MHKVPPFPRLPGFNFDQNIGRTKFNRSQLFDKIGGQVCYMVDKPHTSGGSRYPALYAWGEEPPGPTWLAFDGQRLKFKAYFKEDLAYGREPYRVRLVDISFFLEDGTMKVSEPSIENCGLEQGVLVKRQRIPLSDPVKYRYFDILDLNIGKEPELFGRVYKIYDCDRFTRRFLNRMGIPVPDPLNPPADPLYQKKKIIATTEKSHQKRPDKLGNFLKYDRKVLRFYGFWDDSERPHGYVHDLEILYYKSDDTIEILEVFPARNGGTTKSLFVKRMKIPKFFTNMEPVGSSDPYTLLNVMGENTMKGYFIPDNSYKDKTSEGYYRECDLSIGAQMDVFGRRVVITDLDEFTRHYYTRRYGLEDFTPIRKPGKQSDEEDCPPRYLPPYNGYGSYEDSLGFCFSVIPKKPKLFTDKYFRYENQENDSRVLRFGCKMISDRPENRERCFVINVFLFDKTVAIVEIGCTRKPGRKLPKSLFQKRLRIRLPGQEIFTSEEPQYYEPQDFYIGACVNLSGFKFDIKTADEYTLNYMEKHSNEFPKADIKMIMAKVRDRLRPRYREFTEEYPPDKTDDDPPMLSLHCLRESMLKYVGGECISEHEIITIARHYAFGGKSHQQLCPRDYIRAVVHNELVRAVWNDLDRLQEDICAWDRDKTGYLGRDQLYVLLRSNRLPLQRDLVRLMLDYVEKNSEGKIDCRDLIQFLDIKVDPLPPVVPLNLKEVYWTIEEKPRDCDEIDYGAFLRDLGLENEVKDLGCK